MPIYRAASSLVSTSFVQLIMFAVTRSATCCRSSAIDYFFKSLGCLEWRQVHPFFALCLPSVGTCRHPPSVKGYAKVGRQEKAPKRKGHKAPNPKAFQRLFKDFSKKVKKSQKESKTFPIKKRANTVCSPSLP